MHRAALQSLAMQSLPESALPADGGQWWPTTDEPFVVIIAYSSYCPLGALMLRGA